MTREEIRKDILGIDGNCILAELPTSVGKSKLALDYINEKKLEGKILIVIPRLVLIDNWKKEFVKWGYEPFLQQVTFTTYKSLHKHVSTKFELVIFDECHHLSERAREITESLQSDYYLLLSATVTRTLKKEIKILFPKIHCYNISVREAIDNSILPDPKVYLVPLQLDNKNLMETFVIHPTAKIDGGEITFQNRFRAKAEKKIKYTVRCTQQQYYDELSSMAEYYKKKYYATNNGIMLFKWQLECRNRLVYLSGLKNEVTKKLLEKLDDKRTLVFCNGIKQTELLGEYCINSDNKESSNYLKSFNEGTINHITACDMLNEGVNLVNCQVGIFVHINSSETIKIQKLGRILRHEEPVVYYLYYKNTREEDIIKGMLGNYNQELITVLNL